ncbi:hypothetical protein BDW62DRAFT_202536 [Aspergillus aurantiobrunneus]
MPINHQETPLNPTVEEVPDESARNTADPAPDTRISWPQICTQHDSVLSSHLEMLQALRSQVSDPEASRVISTMIERTNKLVLQFEGVKKHIAPRATATRGNDSMRDLSGAGNELPRTTPLQSGDGVTRKRRKRERVSNDMEPEVETSEPVLDVQPLKRKRIDAAIPGADEDMQNAMPVSLETEDISDEVQRRLEIKEEQRRKRDSKPEKRKRERDSLGSNTSSSMGSKKPRKKYRLSGQVGR